MTPMPIQFPTFVGFASGVVGLLCYAFSSSFNHLFGQWNWLKIFLYSVFSFIICLAILFAKVRQHSTSLLFKAHLSVVVLTATSVYSFFYDKAVNGKPDAYSLISCAAFAIMSLSLSRQTFLGIEVDLLYFFLGSLIVQLMKIKWWLAIVGAGFSYSLIILRSSLDNSPPENGYVGVHGQDHVVIQVRSQIIMPKLMACIEELKQNNSNLVDRLLEQVKDYLQTTDDQSLVTDHNFVVDALPSGIINELHETAKLTVAAGLENEYCHAYSGCRKEFLKECLSRLERQGILPSVRVWKNRTWYKPLNVFLRILFPSERQLSDRVFFGFSAAADLSFVDVCQESMTEVFNFFNRFTRGFRSTRLYEFLRVFEILRDLIPELEPLFPTQYSVSLRKEAIMIQKRLGVAIRDILMELVDQKFRDVTEPAVPNGGLHPKIGSVVEYLCDGCWSRQTLEQVFQVAEGTSSSLSLQMASIEEQLESKLEAISKIYTDPALGYIFMINNGWYILQQAKDSELGILLGDDWIRKSTAKVQQNIEHYQRTSWNKVLDFLKLDGNELEAPNVAAESMKEKINFFNLHFEEICRVHSTWDVFHEQLRKEIRIPLDNLLVPAYGNFIGRFLNVLGKDADEYIEYSFFEIDARLNNLFQGSRGSLGG